MRQVIYVAHRCHQCALVKDYVKSSGLKVEIFNVDRQKVQPPVDVFIYPALFIDEQLVAYGADIITYLKSESKL